MLVKITISFIIIKHSYKFNYPFLIITVQDSTFLWFQLNNIVNATKTVVINVTYYSGNTRWFKYDRD